MPKNAPIKTQIQNPTEDGAGFENESVTPPDEAYSGAWIKRSDPERPRAGDGRTYTLAVDDEDPRGKTHKLRCEATFEEIEGERVMTHPGFMWEGSKAEFQACFEKA